jgi:ankyrin repeat protein
MQSAEDGFIDVVELLVAHGADVNATDKYGDSIVGIAKYHGHNQVVELLLAKGAVDTNKPTSREIADHDSADAWAVTSFIMKMNKLKDEN